MSDIFKVDTNIEPIDALSEKSKFTAFICKEYPASCDECLYGWHSICQVSSKEKEKSMYSTHRPFACPLIKPTYKYDKSGYRYPSLDEAEWAKRNPILISGGIVISKDLRKAKVGNGTYPYLSLPFITMDHVPKIQSPTSIDLSHIKTPEDIIKVFNALQVKATELGYPISLFGVVNSYLKLTYDNDYPDRILVSINSHI